MFIIQIYLARAKVGLTFPLYLRTPTWPSLVIESANAKGRALVKPFPVGNCSPSTDEGRNDLLARATVEEKKTIVKFIILVIS